MLTTTHVLIAGALLTRRNAPKRQNALAFFLVAIFPDFSVFLMVAYSSITSVGRGNMWGSPDGLYWQELGKAFRPFQIQFLYTQPLHSRRGFRPCMCRFTAIIGGG